MVRRRVSKFSKVVTIAGIILTIAIIALGSYTRLQDAGLGCPDWPTCYGQIKAPSTLDALQKARVSYPHSVIEVSKAKIEMLHRYFASSLSIIIVSLLAIAIYHRKNSKQPKVIPALLAVMLVLQALLGMWTVTLKLYPVVVMAHLLGGLILLSLFAAHHAELNPLPNIDKKWPLIKTLSLITLVVIFLQIAMGGWTSSNYAAMVCPDFPYCQGQLIPNLDFKGAFDFVFDPKLNYQGGLLDNSARMTIHFLHRFGAMLSAAFTIALSLALIFGKTNKNFVVSGVMLLVLVGVQITLGIINVVKFLPIHAAVSHTVVAALILLTITNITVRLFAVKKYE